jgi:DNA-binding CsgD family transcriptional regulator
MGRPSTADRAGALADVELAIRTVAAQLMEAAHQTGSKKRTFVTKTLHGRCQPATQRAHAASMGNGGSKSTTAMSVSASSRQFRPFLEDDDSIGVQVSAHICAAFDMLALGIVFAGRDGRILFANRVARCLFRRRRGLIDHHGQLRAETPKATQALHRHLRGASSVDVHQAGDGVVMMLPTANRRPLTALIVESCSDGMSDRAEAPAILFVWDPATKPDMDEDYLAHVHHLTPAEARLLRSLLDGKRLADHARDADIGLFTAKGYLKQIFSKTGASRQADLVRLVLTDPILRLVAVRQAGSE